MNIEFEDKAWEELYLTGATLDKVYKRLPKDTVKRYAKVVNFMRAARRVEDLFLINSLLYEKKEGNLKDREAAGLTTSIVCYSEVHLTNKVLL